MDITQKLWERVYFPLFEGVLKQRSIERKYKDVLATQWLSAAELETLQLSELNKLLAFAKSKVPYYRDDARVPPALGRLSELSSLPILTKRAIQENHKTIIDDEQKLWWKSTGGSTGEPLRFAHTPESHDWRTAMSLRGYQWGGAPPGSRQAYIWGIPTDTLSFMQKQKQALHRWTERKRLFNCFGFSPDTMRDCYAELKRFKPQVVVGYTNATYELAQFMLAEGLPALPSVKSVLCAAEKVHPAQREIIAKAFSAEVFDTYGSREFMLIASECQEHRLHTSMENLIVEVVDDTGTPVRAGETGRILVTDLHNYAMPFIRYEIGDLAKRGSSQCACGRELQVLDDIVGRVLDVIRTPAGRVIPGELFPHVLKDFPNIRRFQVVQENLSEIRLDLMLSSTVEDSLIPAVRAKLFELVGGEIELSIQIVDTIPLSPSGKHRVTMSKLEHQ